MKKFLQKTKQRLMVIFVLLFALCISIQVQAQTADAAIINGTIEDWNSTYNAGQVNELSISVTGGAIASKKPCNASANENTLSLSSSDSHWFEIKVPSTSSATINKIVLNMSGNSSGTTEHWDPVFYCPETPFNTSNVLGYKEAKFYLYSVVCSDIIVEFPENIKSIRMYRRAKYTPGTPGVVGTGDNFGTGQTTNIRSIAVFLNYATGPTVKLISGEQDAVVMSTEEMTPVVYTWQNSTDNATFAWDDVAPENIQAVTNTDEKTITISGTAGNVTENTTYNYTVSIPDGNTINGSVTVTPYSTPAPVFSDPTNKLQTVKPGTAIVDIVYTVENATNAVLSGLPDAFSGVYDNGTFTISGTPEVEVTYPAIYNYTVTATPLDGYTGDAVMATGTITIKDPNTKAVAYVVNTDVSGNDTQIYPLLQTLYDVTIVPIANITTSYDFSPYDLVVLTETPGSGSVGMKALWGIDKPLLNMKAFAVQANTWNIGAAGENTGTRQNIRVVQPTHPIFDDVTLDNDTLVMLSGVGSSEKGLQTATFGTNNVNNPGITLAYLTTSTTAISIFETKKGVDANGSEVSVPGVKNETLQNKYLQIGISDISCNNLTPDALKIIGNATAYLISPLEFENTEAKILSMTIGGSAVTIDEAAKTGTVDLLEGTDLSSLNVSLTLSTGATLTAPSSLTGVDFTNPVTFTVQAEDETVSPVDYTVTVTANTPTSVNKIGVASKVIAVGSSVVVAAAKGAKVKVVNLAGVTLYQGVLSSDEETLPVILKTGVYAVLVDGLVTKVLVK
jgi:hypothetical protein